MPIYGNRTSASEIFRDYELPIATALVLGGIKAGGDITVSPEGVITVNSLGGVVPESSAAAQAKADAALASAKSYADTKVSDLVASSPEALDTLKELADALGNDPNFATTMTNLIGTKAATADLTAHTGNGDIHVTTENKTTWNGKADAATVASHIADAVSHITAAERTGWNNKANGDHNHDAVYMKKPVKATATLTAAGWTGSAIPYSQTINVSSVVADSDIDILPAVNPDATQLEQLQKANLQDGGQAAGTITLLAYGEKPTVDINIRVTVRN